MIGYGPFGRKAASIQATIRIQFLSDVQLRILLKSVTSPLLKGLGRGIIPGARVNFRGEFLKTFQPSTDISTTSQASLTKSM